MTPIRDAAGNVTGVANRTYQLRGITEKIAAQGSISGPCTYKGGGQTDSSTGEQTQARDGWFDALNTNRGKNIHIIFTTSLVVTRQGFKPGTGNVLGSIRPTFAKSGPRGAVTEDITVQNPAP
jgi:hypothetical protein